MSASASEVNIYSAQKEHLIRPILNQFEGKTGIKVNLTTGDKAALVSRIAMEGANTPADILLTVDIGNVYQAKEKGLLQAIESDILTQNIPENVRDAEGFWYGLTLRSRNIFYHKNKIDGSEIDGYAALADPKWRDSILIRSSSNVYNQSLVAFMLSELGEEKTLAWAKGLVANMARDPQGGDTDQLRALAAGEGKIAVANSYYYGRLIGEDASLRSDAVVENVAMLPSEQYAHGIHVNIRGGGVTKYAKNKDNAIKLMEFLVSKEAQEFFAQQNLEYPVRRDVAAADVVAAWGKLQPATVNLDDVGKLHQKAIGIMDEAGWK